VNVATGNVKRRVKDGGVAFDTVSRARAVQVRVQLKCGRATWESGCNELPWLD
jgi:hypothetical protein